MRFANIFQVQPIASQTNRNPFAFHAATQLRRCAAGSSRGMQHTLIL
jgi:hypothetical protein